MSKGIVFGDQHAKDNVTQRRFRWAGKYIKDEAPDWVVFMGDLGDFPSLGQYDKGRVKGEGKRYSKDLRVTNEAMEIMANAAGPAWDKVRKEAIGGNHDEGRIERAANENPSMYGTISVDDIKYEDYGINYTPYMEPLKLEGYVFQHYFGSGIMQRPIGGDNHAVTLLKTLHMSCVQAHTHLFGYAERVRADGRKIQAFIPGCYLDPRQWEDYAGQANKMWWKGALELLNAKDGYTRDWRRTSIETLQNRYEK